MKILVLAGGLSPERNVSRSTGTMVTQALQKNGHRAAMIDMFFGQEGTVTEGYFDQPLNLEGAKVNPTAPDLVAIRASRPDQSASLFGPNVLKLCAMADMVFLALHGQCGEDGRVQATLDMLGIPYTGSGHLASAIAMDKDLTKRFLQSTGIPTPQWVMTEYTADDIDGLVSQTKLPCVVKPVDSGSSIGVFIAQDEAQLRAGLVKGLETGNRVVVEDFVAGREIQVGVLDGVALPPIEIILKDGFYDYESKYQPDVALEICPAEIPDSWTEAVQKWAVIAYNALDLAVYSRVDFIVTADGTPWFLEINTLPGMTPTSLMPQEAAATGMDYNTLCQRIVELSLEARSK